MGPKGRNSYGPIIAVLIAAGTTLGATVSVAAAQDLDALRQAAEDDQRDADAQCAYGRALLRAGKYGEAERRLKRAARLQRDSSEALYDVARVAFARKDYRAARRACGPLKRRDRGGVLAHVCMARAFLVWNRSARAFEELEAALEKNPNHFEALLALGDAHRIRANVEEAEQAYEKAAEVQPDDAAPHLGLGRLFVAVDRRRDAIRHLRRAHELDPDWPAVQYQLGRLIGTTDEAKELLRRAIARRPSWADPHAALATLMLREERAEQAADHFRKALERNDELAPAHAGLGRALVALGELDEAQMRLERALELVPNSARTVQALAELYEKRGEREKAFEHYRRAADANPSNPEPLLAATRLALQAGRDVLAAGFLDRLLDRHTDLARGLALYGDVWRIRKDREKAEHYYRRALEQGQGPLDRDRVRAAIDELDANGDPEEQLQPAMVRPRR